MLEFISAPENAPFAVALLVLLIITVLEGVGALFGAGISNVLASLFPDIDPHIAIEVDGTDLDSPGPLGRVLSWLRVGQVPILVLIIVFLAGFAIAGLLLQKLLLATFGFMLPAAIAFIPAFAVSLPTVRVVGGVLNKIVPKDETSAVSSDTFIGRLAIITLGEASKGSPAEGKVKDSFAYYHYIMIEPDNDGDVFVQGSEVLLVRQDGATFYAIANDNQIMSED